MIETKLTIVNKSGLHARPGAEFVGVAGKFKSSIELQRVGEEDIYNAKSIIMLLALGLSQGEEAILYVNGEDEAEATAALVELIQHGLKD